ncbi:hypothetical protein IAR55_001807 [Kwoniella newhampshirensis]|uniref:D-xylose 1-dehydrogenase (NADP(+), D-xylono-1,5-lactone-forming) n=1 Tax=Kwoniella newhampshirensis TaxID=1651941 RepID=A0AAW0Z349_9TREE
MIAATPYIARWGIIGTGWISSEFCKDIALVRDDVKDVLHSIVAVGSRDKAKAQSFIDEFCPKGANAQAGGISSLTPKAVEGYEAVYNDPEVDIIYVGTPNQAHFENAKAALEAGKHCLLEKPATLNAAEWAVLSELAKGKGLFLMEAVWTRFLPLTLKLQELIHEQKVIGDVRAVHSDFSMEFLGVVPPTHRTFNIDMAGGSMLDLGPYTLLPALLYLYHAPANEQSPPENLIGSMLKAETGVDLSTSITMNFPKINAKAFLSSSFAYNTAEDRATFITGTKGHITLASPGCRPTKATIRRFTKPGIMSYGHDDDEVIELNFPQFGLYFEADAVARSLRDGQLENPAMPHKETAMTMEIFDEVRRQNGYVFRKGLEQVQAS